MQGFNDVLLRTMALLISSSGDMTDPEIEAVRSVYERMTGESVDDEAVLDHLRQAIVAGIDVRSFLQRHGSEFDVAERARLIEGVVAGACASGRIDRWQDWLLDEVAEPLGVSHDDVHAIVQAHLDTGT
ncbi:MAG: TerB family tellurite resistance protein [Planctomycetota bacterium]|jgi:uncharacterized tellurite resistance protein B-like protein